MSAVSSGVSLLTFAILTSGDCCVDPVMEGIETWADNGVYGENLKEASERIYRFLGDKNTTELNLSRLGMQTLPAGLFALPEFKERLLHLDLSENHLTEVPPEISQLDNLMIVGCLRII